MGPGFWHYRLGWGAEFAVSRAFPSWNRSILTEISLCHACSDHEVEDGNAPGRRRRRPPPRTARRGRWRGPGRRAGAWPRSWCSSWSRAWSRVRGRAASGGALPPPLGCAAVSLFSAVSLLSGRFFAVSSAESLFAAPAAPAGGGCDDHAAAALADWKFTACVTHAWALVTKAMRQRAPGGTRMQGGPPAAGQPGWARRKLTVRATGAPAMRARFGR
jgi:hypothetical protein